MPTTKLNNGQLPTTLSSKTIDNSNDINTTTTRLKISGGSNGQVLSTDGSSNLSWITAGGGVSDGDKGDITVASSGTVWTIDNGVVTYAKMQDVSATNRLLGRATAGSGDAEEITIGSGLSLSGTDLRVIDNYSNKVTKTADESVVNSSTLQNDDQLFFTADANSTYQIKVSGITTRSNTASQARTLLSFTVPSGTNGQYYLPSTAVFITTSAGVVISDFADSSTWTFWEVLCIIRTSGTSGTVQLRWACNTPTSQTLTLKSGSYLAYRKL